jgi:hypothetical protein
MFDHRVDCFGLPALPKQTIQAPLRNQIGSRPALRVEQITAPSNRRNQIVILNSLTIKARVGHHHPCFPLALVMSIAADISPQPREISHIAAGSPARMPSQEELRPRAHRMHSFGLVTMLEHSYGVFPLVSG